MIGISMEERAQALTQQKKLLDEQLGIPEVGDPIACFDRMTDLTRQVGQTTEMCRDLPDDGRCVVLVSSLGMAQSIGHILWEIRGAEYPIRNIKFLSVRSRTWREQLRGLNSPVFVDNSAWYLLNAQLLEDLQPFYK